MIISKTPLRMSFVGGGSDIENFYSKNGGAVLSTTIDKYIYINVNKKFDQKIRLAYSKTEEVDNPSLLEHKIVKEVLQYLEIENGVEITTIADIPSTGTGLGSSSSFTVGLINVLKSYKGSYCSKKLLAEIACHIEIDLCGEPIGKQDQYAAAYGGLNLYEFNNDGSVNVRPAIIPKNVIKELESKLLLFYTGLTRSASNILRDQSAALNNNTRVINSMNKMVELTYELIDQLERGDVDFMGEALHRNWILKKSLSSKISNELIDDYYEKARKMGADGGKILGAGAGGFMLLFADECHHEKIIEIMKPMVYVPFHFENNGSQIIFYNE